MALTRMQKETRVEELTKKMSEASSVIFAHYIGLNVPDISALRNSLRKNGSEMKVAKKTLIQIASKSAGLPAIDGDTLDGPVAVIFSFEDPLSGAQAAFAFSKDHKQVELIGGFYDGKVLSKNETVSLAKMPGRQQLLAIFAGMIRSPLVSFASACNSPLSGFARALDAMAEKGVFSSNENNKINEDNERNESNEDNESNAVNDAIKEEAQEVNKDEPKEAMTEPLAQPSATSVDEPKEAEEVNKDEPKEAMTEPLAQPSAAAVDEPKEAEEVNKDEPKEAMIEPLAQPSATAVDEPKEAEEVNKADSEAETKPESEI